MTYVVLRALQTVVSARHSATPRCGDRRLEAIRRWACLGAIVIVFSACSGVASSGTTTPTPTPSAVFTPFTVTFDTPVPSPPTLTTFDAPAPTPSESVPGILPPAPVQLTPAPGRFPAGAVAAEDANAHLGETATVCGHVASASYLPASVGAPTYLNLERPYPNQAFTILIWVEHRATYGGSPETFFADKDVCARGLITVYNGKPQMEGEDSVRRL
jgi:hypothetical protein